MKLRAEQEQPHHSPMVFWQSRTMYEGLQLENQRRKKEAEKCECVVTLKSKTRAPPLSAAPLRSTLE